MDRTADYGGIRTPDSGRRGGDTLATAGTLTACETARAGDTPAPEGCNAAVQLSLVELGASRARPVAPLSCPANSRWDGSLCRPLEGVPSCPAGTSPVRRRCVREAGRTVEASYAALDDGLRHDFDQEAGQHRFGGDPVGVLQDSYGKAASDAKAWDEKLLRLWSSPDGGTWSVVALARSGTLWDSIAAGLRDLRPPDLTMFTDKEIGLLATLEQSGQPEYLEKAAAFRETKVKEWRAARDRQLDSGTRTLVDRYARAVVEAERLGIEHPAITHALARLSYHSIVLGDARMSELTRHIEELRYQPGLFVRLAAARAKR